MQQSLGLELQITQQLQNLAASMNNLHTKLFGEQATENNQGRLPRLEATADDHDERLKKLEGALIKYTAFGSALSFGISAVAWYLVHVVFKL